MFMKHVYLGLMICVVALAQTKSTAPASKGTAAKSTAAKSTASGALHAATKGTTRSASAATKAPAVKPNLLEPASLNAKAPAVFRARFTTSKGPVVIEVTRAWSPNGADRFYNLVRAG